MKKFILIALIAAVTFSCEKRKEIKEWKKRSGNYFSNEVNILYSGEDTLYFNEVQVVPSGLSLFSPNPEQPSINFNVFHKSYNENAAYQYRIEFSSIYKVIFSSSGVTQEHLDPETFTGGREFYLSFENDTLIFIIVDQGEIKEIRFKR